MQFTHKHRHLVALLLILSMIIVACSGDSEDASDDVEVTDDVVATEVQDNDDDTVEDIGDNVDLEPQFSVDVDGLIDAIAFNQSDGEFRYDYEQPATSAEPDNIIGPNTGMYTLIFSNDPHEVQVSFSDTFEAGIHVVPTEDSISVEETLEDAFIPLLTAQVEIDGTFYTTVRDGTLNLINFADNLASGEFEFTLAETPDTEQEITLLGTFSDLTVETDPIEAVDELEEE